MRTFIKENKTSISVIVISFIIFALVSYFSEPLGAPASKDDDENQNYTVPVSGKNIKMFDMKGEAKAVFEGDHTLNYSLSFPSTVLRETKNDGKDTFFFYKGIKVAELSFLYEGARGYSPEDYIKKILGQRIPIALAPGSVKIGDFDYITAGASNSYFRVTSFKKNEWLGALEVYTGNEELEKVILNSLKVK
jgi:hypothetical protein